MLRGAMLLVIALIAYSEITFCEPLNVKITTEWGEPLAYERVLIVIFRGNEVISSIESILDGEGSFTIYVNESYKKVKVKLIDYGIEEDVNLSWPLVSPLLVKVSKLGKLRIRVTGSAGQGVPGISILVLGPINWSGYTDHWGCVEFLLVEGEYQVVTKLKEGVKTQRVKVLAGEIYELNYSTDVFIAAGNLMLSASEFMGCITLFLIAVITLFITIYEYTIWRRRKMVRVLSSYEERPIEYFPSDVVLSPEVEEKAVWQSARALLDYYESKVARVFASIYKTSIGINKLRSKLLNSPKPQEFEDAVSDLLQILGFKVLHIGYRSGKMGETDIIAISSAYNIALIVECKSKPNGSISIKDIRQALVDKYSQLREHYRVMNLLVSNAQSIDPHAQEFLKGISSPIYILLRRNLEELLNAIQRDVYPRGLLIDYLEEKCRYGS